MKHHLVAPELQVQQCLGPWLSLFAANKQSLWGAMEALTPLTWNHFRSLSGLAWRTDTEATKQHLTSNPNTL